MTLLDRLGGAAVVVQVSDALYDRLLADDEVGPLFAETHMATQRAALSEYFVAVLSGESDAQAARLREAHSTHDVNDRHFSILAGHLADVLDETGVDPEAAADLLDLVAGLRADVVSSSQVAGTWEPIDPDV